MTLHAFCSLLPYDLVVFRNTGLVGVQDQVEQRLCCLPHIPLVRGAHSVPAAAQGGGHSRVVVPSHGQGRDAVQVVLHGQLAIWACDCPGTVVVNNVESVQGLVPWRVGPLQQAAC